MKWPVRWPASPHEPAGLHLLACALVLRRFMGRRGRWVAVIPYGVYREAPQEVFQDAFHDALLTLYPDAQQRVRLEVRDTSHFEVYPEQEANGA